MRSHGQALLVGKTRLLESQANTGLCGKVSDSIGNLQSLVLFPAGIGIGVQYLARFHFLRHPMNADDVGCRVFTDLDLKLSIPLGTVFGDALCHGARVGAGNDLVEDDFLLAHAAQQRV